MSRNEEPRSHAGDERGETATQGSPDESSLKDELSRADGPSEKQIRANRENAKRSTGPRTDAGKARSSQNARKTGIFFSKIEPVADGFFAEDPDEFFERVQVLVESMAPRDPIEVEVATRIAGVLVKLQRLDRWSAATIQDAAIMRPLDIERGARSDRYIRPLAQVAGAFHMYLMSPELIEDPDFEAMAVFLRFRGPERDVRIDGFWDDENVPSSDEDWRDAYEALKDALWATEEDSLAWADETHLKLALELEQVERLEERIAAKRIMAGPFELQLIYESRLLNSLRLLRRDMTSSRSVTFRTRFVRCDRKNEPNFR